VKYIDLQFTDVPGRLQHVTVPIQFMDDDSRPKEQYPLNRQEPSLCAVGMKPSQSGAEPFKSYGGGC
jgi:glutamine synthetase